MTETIPTSEPTEFIAGDTVRFRRTVAGYSPVAGDTLAYAITGKVPLSWVPDWVEDDGDGWLVTIPAEVTSGLPTGSYAWYCRVTNGDGVVSTVSRGTWQVTADPALAQGDDRPWDEIALEKVRARLNGDISAGIMNYMMPGGRSLMRYSLTQLLELERTFAQRVAVRQQGGVPRITSIPFAFGRPS